MITYRKTTTNLSILFRFFKLNFRLKIFFCNKEGNLRLLLKKSLKMCLIFLGEQKYNFEAVEQNVCTTIDLVLLLMLYFFLWDHLRWTPDFVFLSSAGPHQVWSQRAKKHLRPAKVAVSLCNPVM